MSSLQFTQSEPHFNDKGRVFASLVIDRVYDETHFEQIAYAQVNPDEGIWVHNHGTMSLIEYEQIHAKIKRLYYELLELVSVS